MKLVAIPVNALFALAALACSPIHSRAYEPVVSNYGIGTVLHPLQEPSNSVSGANDPALQAAKDHVHVYAVNGLNPMCLGNFNGLCGYIKNLGYHHTYFGQLYTCGNFAARAREVRQQDPQAKIVLIGFSLGSNSVRSIANDLAKDGVAVDLLVYMVGDYVTNVPESRPDNVRRIVNLRAKGIVLTGGDMFFNGADIDGARNARLEVRHILVPSRRETLELISEELHTLVTSAPAAAPIPSPTPATIMPVRPVTSPYNGQ